MDEIGRLNRPGSVGDCGPESSARWVKAQDVYCVPWSLCMTVESGWRFSIAIPSAFTTSVAAGLVSIDQPTTRREKVSKTTAQYTLPSRVGCSVISVTHN